MFSQHFASLKEGRQGFFSSSLFVLRQPCLGKIIFPFKVFVHILAVYVGMQWISIFPLFLLCYGDISLDILLVRFLFILLLYLGGVSCVFCPFITFTCSVYFGAGFVGTFLAGWVVYLLSV
jgi:hypothetical protein